MSRLGILGGTFNPPHIGHLICAQEAYAQLGLDRVLFVPAAKPPHKEIAADPGAERRCELCRLATQDDPRFDVSRIELDRPGRSYTVDTLRALRERGEQDELTFIVGGDMARSLPSWREPEAILRLATLAVAEREGHERAAIREAIAPLAGAERVRFFDMPRIDVSSSLIRDRVAQSRPIRYLVPGPVADHIETNDLYRGGA